MPERVTREERMVSLAIEKARKAKQELSAKKRMNIEPTQVNEFDSEVEVQKIKRPKVQDASKITNQTQDKEGYGLAGETLKKQSTRKLNIEKLIGKTGAVEEIQDMIEKEFGKVKNGSSSSYSPSFIIPIDLVIFAESTKGDSEDYTINAIEFMKK